MTKAAWQGIAIGVVSVVAMGMLFYLIYGRADMAETGRFAFLPPMNAACNATTTLLILHGLLAIHRGNQEKHRHSMLGAFVSSTIFLIGYVVYVYYHGDSRFPGQGWIRPVYFFILISHILLSVVTLPLVLTTFFLALTGRFSAHRKVARFTYPVWLYVSVTGVAIFFFLNAYRA